MSEGTEGKDGNEVALSRSHLLAAIAAGVLLLATGFAAGLSVGDGGAAPVPPPGLLGEVADDRLVDLLARVEAAGRMDGGVGDLSFPSALTGDAVAGVVDRAPAGSHTVEVGRYTSASEASMLRNRLRGDGVPAWVGLDLVGGTPWYAVRVGGYADHAAAEAAAADDRLAEHGMAVVTELQR